MNEPDSALVELLKRLAAFGYDFVTVTPETHRRVMARRDRGRDLRDALGWSLPVPLESLPSDLTDLLRAADALIDEGGWVRSRIRVSRVGENLFVHSAYPTDRPDAVFLGPDTYRFVRFVRARLSDASAVGHLVDMGAGSGAGAICAASCLSGAKLTLVDSNPEALRLARINAVAAGVVVELAERLPGAFDLWIANPPFIQDSAGRAYRDGGQRLGAEASLLWTLEAARRITPGGRMLLYTGSAIVAGGDGLLEELERRLTPLGCSLRYEEIDPDIFGEELDCPAYRDVERIAAVGVEIIRERSWSAAEPASS